MMKDQYANFVVQTMLENAEQTQCARMLAQIKPVVPELSRFQYGKHIIGKLKMDSGYHSILSCVFSET